MGSPFKFNSINLSKMNEDSYSAILIALGTFIAGVFGKEGWAYLTRSKELNSERGCREKIRILEIEMAKERMQTSQVKTSVEMILVIIEEEEKYQAIASKVREIINRNIDDE